MHLKSIVLALLLFWVSFSYTQIQETHLHDDSNELEAFFAETKQVNQFLRRFNAEEDSKGVKFSVRDSLYHNNDFRRQYIKMLFDEENNGISELIKSAFVNDVCLPENPKFLDFHADDWFGEAEVKFRRGSKDVYITLLMKLVKENLGYKWVIDDVRYNPYESLYVKDEMSSNRFLHPLSHELDFMNLDRVFREKEHTGDYFRQGFEPSKLSIFLYELRSGVLDFDYVAGIKFHFFQIEGWYFEISEFNRPGLNRGWLISNIIKLEDGQKQNLIDYLYNLD